NSLRELLAWKLIRRAPLLGDRRDHYEAETDLWEMVTRIAQGRKERELDPAAAALRACLAEAEGDRRISPVARHRRPLVRPDAVDSGAQDHGSDADGIESGEPGRPGTWQGQRGVGGGGEWR